MSEASRSWVPQDVLWELGASFVDATAETAASVIETTMERVARLLDGVAAGIWRIDLVTMQGVNIHRWSVDSSSDLGPGAIVVPDPAVGDAVLAGGGIGVVGLELLLGETACAQRGWSGGMAVVAVIDQSADETVVLVVASGEANWDEVDFELVRGTALLLQQFNRRVRAEVQLHERHRLDALTAALAARLQSVSHDTIDEEVERALVQMRDIVSADAIVLIEVIDETTIALPYLLAARSFGDEWRTLSLPEISAMPGGEGLTLREYIAQPRIVDLADLVDAIMGPEVTEALSLRVPRRTAALLPASVASGDAILALTRLGDGDWLPEEFDALSTLASIIAQTRGRVAAEQSSADRLDAQRALAATGKLFLEASSETAEMALHATLDRMGALLGADLAVIASIGRDDESVTIVGAELRSDEPSVQAGIAVEPGALRLIEEMLSEPAGNHVQEGSGGLGPLVRTSVDCQWTAVVAAIRGAGLPPSALCFVWADGRLDDPTGSQDLANATADLIGQLNVRLRAEDEVHSRLAIDAVMSELADDFLGASQATADAVIARSLERFGSAMGLAGVAIRRIGAGVAVVESVWAPDGHQRPAIGHSIATAGEITLDDIARFQEDSKNAGWVELRNSLWGADVDVTTLPVFVGGRVDAAVNLAGISRIAGHEAEAYRSFAVMLGQFRSRVEEERRGLHRLAAQRLLSSCAAELAEATPDDFRDVVVGLLADTAEFCAIDEIVDWRVDRHRERYVRTARWISPELAHLDSDATAPWGTRPILDEVRTASGIVEIRSVDPTPQDPSRLAIPRGEGRSVDHVLLATSFRSDPWNDEVVELLASLSRMIQEVDVRIAAQRYAHAAFEDAPIGIVLRDEMLKLITCNQAFVDFVGAGSVGDLVGTAPESLYDDPRGSAGWEEQAEGQFTAEAAFRGPGGSRVLGQMRGSVVTGDNGESFWLIHVEDVTERRRVEELLRFQASHDELTGLANRRRLLEEIRGIAHGSGSVAVLLLDLDRFKNINDSLGHGRGDELLVVVADRLRLAVRPGDLVARLGGDEFAVVLPGPVGVADAEFVAERLIRLIGEPVMLGHQEIYPTASIGIAVADEQTAVDDLLRRADTAMYLAKAQGRARAELFDEELRVAFSVRMATESGLRGALRSDELLVHYQPEVSLHDGRVLGAEALIRWQHPEQGLLPAAAFIEIAEDAGLVVEMGAIVLAEACREAASWPGGDDGPIVRVNLAAAQLQRGETVSLVRSVLSETGLLPARLCLEITESAMMSDVNRAEDILHRLKGLGVSLAIDDFGTGFSSLAYLKRFPVDALKIDRTFVSDLGRSAEDEAFVRAIISLAEALDLDLVAEGVETEIQAEILVRLGCHRAQGFLFARPGPPETLRARLEDRVG